MRPGWNPTRRNRNQGTAKRGHGQNNRMVIPCVWRSGRAFYEVLRQPVIVTRGIPTPLKFYVEAPRDDCRHACSIDDIVRVLRRLPSDHMRTVVAIVLRQPTRKQAMLRPVWGRMIYTRDVGLRRGPAILLDAQPREMRWLQPLSTQPADERELERLREDGHSVTRERKGWWVEGSAEAIRATQLYRTLLHEIGHHVDRLEHLARHHKDAAAEATLDEQFFARPHVEREAAAHRYADTWAASLRASRAIPFASIVNDDLRAEGIDPAWFASG
jgi:hypothetical protein